MFTNTKILILWLCLPTTRLNERSNTMYYPEFIKVK